MRSEESSRKIVYAMRWIASSAIAVVAFVDPAQAFKSPEHQAATTQAVNSAGTVAPDIQKFGNQIINWSFGISAGGTGLLGEPAEQLAHAGDQTLSISDVHNNQGPFDSFMTQITDQYQQQNFSNDAPRLEGAYVLMGTCVHLIEDQASYPHGANVLHSQDWWSAVTDAWEVFDVRVGFTGTGGAGVPPGSDYDESLAATQAQIPGLVSALYNHLDQNGNPVPDQFWLFNDQLRQMGDPTKNADRYAGQYDPNDGGVDPGYLGAYGGPNFTNIYSQDQTGGLDGLYTQQGTQAADFAFNFLLNLSKSLPPIGSELMIGGAGTGGAPAVINSQTGTPISFRISENRTQGVSVNVYVQDTNQAIVTSGDAVTLSSFRSADGLSDSTSLPGPNTWSNNQISLFGTLATDMTLLPFDGQLQLNWNGQVVGAPLASGTHTLCVTATPYPSDSHSTPSQPLCGSFKTSDWIFVVERGSARIWQKEVSA
jgi:hypothetical protein